MITYLLVFLIALALSVGITPLVIRLAVAKRIMDTPGFRKVHRKPIPRLGGVAICAANCGTIALVIAANIHHGAFFGRPNSQMAALLAGALAAFTVGLIDDIYALRARTKMICHILIATAVCAMGIRFGSFSVGTWMRLELGWLSFPLTVLWIVAITNAVNLIDGLDGLAAGVCAMACGVIFLFSAHLGQTVMALLMLSLLGSLVGFLLFNFHPAKIFMGDSGTYFLGFILGAGSVMFSAKTSTFVGLALPVLTLGVPLFDMFTAILRRFIDRRSPFAPDSRHIHHRLLQLGIKHQHVVLILYGATCVLAILAAVMMVTKNLGTLAIFGAVLMLLFMMFGVVGAMNLKGTLRALRRNRLLAWELKQAQHGFEDAELRLREAKSLMQWWEGVCFAAQELQFLRLTLSLPSRGGQPLELTWQTPKALPEPMRTLRMLVPVQDRRRGHVLQMHADAYVNNSLEAAGRRAAFFDRLIDEHGLGSLPLGKPRKRPQPAIKNRRIMPILKSFENTEVQNVSPS